MKRGWVIAIVGYATVVMVSSFAWDLILRGSDNPSRAPALIILAGAYSLIVSSITTSIPWWIYPGLLAIWLIVREIDISLTGDIVQATPSANPSGLHSVRSPETPTLPRRLLILGAIASGAMKALIIYALLLVFAQMTGITQGPVSFLWPPRVD